MVSATVLKLARNYVSVYGGIFFGFNVGFVAILDNFKKFLTDCNGKGTEEMCKLTYYSGTTALDQGIQCQWDQNNNFCLYPIGEPRCDLFTEQQCQHAPYPCYWNKEELSCWHLRGWGSVPLGLFTGSMLLGAVIGSLISALVLSKLYHRRAIWLIGAIGTLGSVGVSIARIETVDSFWLLIAGRAIVGVAVGLAMNVFPSYVRESTPTPRVAFKRGTMFQIAIAVGILIAGVLGWALGPQISDNDNDQFIRLREQIFIHISTALSVVCFWVGLLVPPANSEGNVIHSVQANEQDFLIPGTSTVRSTSFAVTSHVESRGLSDTEEVWHSFVVAFFLSFAMQMTGINAILCYVPRVLTDTGLTCLGSTMRGNGVLTFWNCATCCLSYFVAPVASRRALFMGGTVLVSVSALLIGFAVYPGNLTAGMRDFCCIVGFGVFIAAYEIAVAPTYYVVSQELFSERYHNAGVVFMMTTQNLFGLIVGGLYYILVEDLSGGWYGAYNKGMGIEYVAFCCFGLLSLPCLWLWMPMDRHEDSTSPASTRHIRENEPAPAEQEMPLSATRSHSTAANRCD